MKCPNCRDKTQRIRELEVIQKNLIVRIRVMLAYTKLSDKETAIECIKYCGGEALKEFNNKTFSDKL